MASKVVRQTPHTQSLKNIGTKTVETAATQNTKPYCQCICGKCGKTKHHKQEQKQQQQFEARRMVQQDVPLREPRTKFREEEHKTQIKRADSENRGDIRPQYENERHQKHYDNRCQYDYSVNDIHTGTVENYGYRQCQRDRWFNHYKEQQFNKLNQCCHSGYDATRKQVQLASNTFDFVQNYDYRVGARCPYIYPNHRDYQHLVETEGDGGCCTSRGRGNGLCPYTYPDHRDYQWEYQVNPAIYECPSPYHIEHPKPAIVKSGPCCQDSQPPVAIKGSCCKDREPVVVEGHIRQEPQPSKVETKKKAQFTVVNRGTRTK